MSIRSILFFVLLVPVFALAQSPATSTAVVPLNAPTLSVLLANRPPHVDEAQWLKLMEEPVNHSLYPLLVTQAMLDTLDTRQLDMRFQYVMVGEKPVPTAPVRR
jgi:hypothetical protein